MRPFRNQRHSSSRHNTPIVSLQNVFVFYKRYSAIEDVTLDILRGEILAIVGEHRAGKTTLVKTIAGLISPDRGRVQVNGHNTLSTKPIVEMIHQGIQTIPALTVLENIFIQAPVAITSRALARRVETARAAMVELGVDVNLDQKASELSTDETIFIDIIRAMCRQPDILILDELDKKLSPEKLESVFRVLARMQHQGVSIVYVSNNFDKLFGMANRICVMRNGRVAGIEESQDIDKVKLINLTYDFVLSRDELTQENKELYFQKKYNETIIENLNQGVVVLDEQGRLVRMNSSAKLWFHGQVADYIGSPIDAWLDQFGLSDSDEIAQVLNQRMAGSWKSSERSDELFQVEVVPFDDELAQHMGIIFTLENVTEQREVEDYLIRTEKVASVSELAAGIAHEINNPLSIITNYLNIMRDDPHNVRVHGDVLKIQNQLQRITDVMGSMLSFSKVSTQQNEKVDLKKLINDAVQLMAHKLQGLYLQFDIDIPDQSFFVQGSKTLLSQVLVNLMDNALEAIHNNGELLVSLVAYENEGIVELVVSDSGPGMSAETREKLFSPFFSTKATKKNAGLGLAICQHIVDAHHGLIFTRRDHMTHFVIRLPLLNDYNNIGSTWES